MSEDHSSERRRPFFSVDACMLIALSLSYNFIWLYGYASYLQAASNIRLFLSLFLSRTSSHPSLTLPSHSSLVHDDEVYLTVLFDVVNSDS